MTTGKTLTNIALIGALAFSTSGCGNRVDHSEYKYNGIIEEDQITFTEKTYNLDVDDNILTVTKLDGRVIEYIDSKNEDLKLESVKISKNGHTTIYFEEPFIKRAQKKFDDYLLQIKKSKNQF
jgi:hypothetical protein